MHLKLIVCFLLITGGLSSDWEKFKFDFDKQYESPEEEGERQEIFWKNVNRMKEYQRTHPDATFTMRINHLTDRRIEELASRSFSNIRSKATEKSMQTRSIIPTRFNWRLRNVITPVYNQSQGASIVPAIAAVEVLESFNAIQTGNLTRGSVNQVAACCGNVIDIFDCILERMSGGICTEAAYTAPIGTCNLDICEPFVTFKSINKLEQGKENVILDWIQDSPLYVAIDASQPTFLAYQEGIYNDPNCAKNDVNHVLQLVGYGFRSGIPYWLCKNSWGEGWGDDGYIRLERGKNMCGITTYVVQIKSENTVNHAVRVLTFDMMYFVFICLYTFSRI